MIVSIVTESQRECANFEHRRCISASEHLMADSLPFVNIKGQTNMCIGQYLQVDWSVRSTFNLEVHSFLQFPVHIYGWMLPEALMYYILANIHTLTRFKTSTASSMMILAQSSSISSLSCYPDLREQRVVQQGVDGSSDTLSTTDRCSLQISSLPEIFKHISS